VLLLSVDRFNTISLWLADMLVVSYGSSTHTSVVEKVIDVVKELFKINNFNSAMALMTALNNASIMRLKQLWDGVKREQRDYFRRFELFMSAKDNFKSYRKHLTQVAQSNKQKAQGSKTPLIPFLGKPSRLRISFNVKLTPVHVCSSVPARSDVHQRRQLGHQGPPA
jgi:hypothetical protein